MKCFRTHTLMAKLRPSSEYCRTTRIPLSVAMLMLDCCDHPNAMREETAD